MIKTKKKLKLFYTNIIHIILLNQHNLQRKKNAIIFSINKLMLSVKNFFKNITYKKISILNIEIAKSYQIFLPSRTRTNFDKI